MSDHIIYMDYSEIREGKLHELEIAINELVEFIKTHNPKLISYNVYFSKDKRFMTVIHIHNNPESLEFHINTVSKILPRFKDLIKLLSINIYGSVGDSLMDKINLKAATLGAQNVKVHKFYYGFSQSES